MKLFKELVYFLYTNSMFVCACLCCRYNHVIRACSLKPDLAILPYGDQTEVCFRSLMQ